MDNKIKIENVLEYIAEMRKTRFESIENCRSIGVHSYSDAYSYGYDKGSLSVLDFIEFLLTH